MLKKEDTAVPWDSSHILPDSNMDRPPLTFSEEPQQLEWVAMNKNFLNPVHPNSPVGILNYAWGSGFKGEQVLGRIMLSCIFPDGEAPIDITEIANFLKRLKEGGFGEPRGVPSHRRPAALHGSEYSNEPSQEVTHYTVMVTSIPHGAEYFALSLILSQISGRYRITDDHGCNLLYYKWYDENFPGRLDSR